MHTSEANSTRIPYQRNVGGLVALLPDGRVEFLHPSSEELLSKVNAGVIDPESVEFDDYILLNPFVDLDRFHLAAPAIAFIETTNLCNLRCKHCYASSGQKRPSEISTSVILGLLDEFAEAGVLQVFLTGGELFAHPDAVRIIQHARSKPFSTQIFTNGILITEEKLAQLPPGTSFFISFDTADPVRTIRGGMDFPRLRACFEWIAKYGHGCRTAISVHRNNIHDAEEIFEWCAVNGFSRPQWLETHPVGRALLHPDILLTKEQVDEVFEVYKRCMDKYSAPADENLFSPTDSKSSMSKLHTIDTIKFCQRLERATGQEKCGRSVAYVSSSGDVFPCTNCMSAGSYKAGNISGKPFMEIWRDGFAEVRSIEFRDYLVCATCPVNQHGIWCQFRCPPLAQNLTGSVYGCGATEYLRLFMLKTNEYWEDRRRRNLKLTMQSSEQFHARQN